MMGQAKREMMEHEEYELNEYQDLIDEKLNGKLDELNKEIEEYIEEFNSEANKLLEDDEFDEFDRENFERAAQEILDRIKGKRELLDNISRRDDLKKKYNR